MSRDPLAVFDDGVVEAVAGEVGLAATDLRELLRRHQRQMRELPGAENLVYEWRKTFPWDALVERREDAYLLAVSVSIWPEFGDALDFSEAELDAVKRVHADQLAADADADLGDREALIVTRP